MGKIGAYFYILSMALLLFHFAGLITGTANHWLLGMLIGWETIQTGSLYVKIITVFGGLGLAGVVIGSLITHKPDFVFYAIFGIFLLNAAWDIVSIGLTVKATAGIVMASLIFAPFLFLFILTCVDYFRGRD